MTHGRSLERATSARVTGAGIRVDVQTPYKLDPRHLIPGPSTGSSLLRSNNGRPPRLGANHLDQQLADGGHG